ncbi:MAG: DNA polymerase III subunit gamma/tau [Spirochaetales bacterium]|nr:DNA polymerase III subunit gamma/tau [Spirochaetales bacterium]
MAYEITATKFRPQSFDKLVGQEFVSETLRNSIQSGRIANAYLLSGPRGVGKTSTARIIAKALNCIHGPTATPCNECDNCKAITAGNHTDVFEIDGASNTGVNEIKKIQEEIMYPPVSAKYKVYIIDEVHMLSKNAFNALLKTIEEPPKGVVFIFATTEINKVIPTIRSRCQLFNLRLIPTETIYKCLKDVLDSYNVKYEENAIKWVAVEGKGSMRDSYTLLDQVIAFCNGDITLERIREKMGLVGEDNIKSLVVSIINKDRAKLIQDYYNILGLGIAPEQLINEMIKFFRNLLFRKMNVKLDSFEYSNADNFNDIVEVFKYEDIENIIEVLFKSFEKSRTSVDLKIEVESMLLKLINYDAFIRPKKLLAELNSLKSALFNPNQSFSGTGSAAAPHSVPQNVNAGNVPLNQGNNIPRNMTGSPNPAMNDNRPTTNIPPASRPMPNMPNPNVQNNNIPNNNIPNNQNVPPRPNPVQTMPADKSDIVKLIKSKISPVNNMLLLALDNIDHIEESSNVMRMIFNNAMYYDTAVKSRDLLLGIVRNTINKDYTIDFAMRKEDGFLSDSDKNVENLKQVFNVNEL